MIFLLFLVIPTNFTHFLVKPNGLNIPREIQVIHNISRRPRIHDQFVVAHWLFLIKVVAAHAWQIALYAHTLYDLLMNSTGFG